MTKQTPTETAAAAYEVYCAAEKAYADALDAERTAKLLNCGCGRCAIFCCPGTIYADKTVWL